MSVVMRTNIDIDDDLIADAMEVTGLGTKKAVVEHALSLVVQRKRQKEAIMEMAGLGWEGDLDEMRDDSARMPD